MAGARAIGDRPHARGALRIGTNPPRWTGSLSVTYGCEQAIVLFVFLVNLICNDLSTGIYHTLWYDSWSSGFLNNLEILRWQGVAPGDCDLPYILGWFLKMSVGCL